MTLVKPNLSDQEFFNLYVKDEDWRPMQNHGLVDKEIKLFNDDKDFPNQIISYLNLFKNLEMKDELILDIGCGWGRGTHTIKKYFKGCDVTGMDIDSSFINYAKSNFKECNYVQDNLFESKLQDSYFDLIVLNCSMHFFYDEDKALQNIRKKLNQNGKILITDLWTKEAFVIFVQKCKTNGLEIIIIEDQTKETIESMKEDILQTFANFKNKVSDESISAFVDIQKDRLELFEKNINRQLKFIIN